MLKGEQLGAAIDAARIKKKLSKKALADRFNVKPPSVQGWIATGRIDKTKMIELITFFSDVVPASHWGLGEGTILVIDEAHRSSPPQGELISGTDLAANGPAGFTATPAAGSKSFDRVALGKSLFERATPRSKAIIEKIAALDAQNQLTDEDLHILEKIIERFSKAQ
ncbi:hypothetical protein [Stutzerimonas kunmingensis]|uniref:hypothetical protein n=1 Tax=Stutzerimonas kunmingensis TaxID=1211807 RepID=UPI00241FF5E4|nr:hypothetical protein [Stutzerimonas kunmingensis]